MCWSFHLLLEILGVFDKTNYLKTWLLRRESTGFVLIALHWTSSVREPLCLDSKLFFLKYIQHKDVPISPPLTGYQEAKEAKQDRCTWPLPKSKNFDLNYTTPPDSAINHQNTVSVRWLCLYLRYTTPSWVKNCNFLWEALLTYFSCEKKLYQWKVSSQLCTRLHAGNHWGGLLMLHSGSREHSQGASQPPCPHPCSRQGSCSSPPKCPSPSSAPCQIPPFHLPFFHLLQREKLILNFN